MKFVDEMRKLAAKNYFKAHYRRLRKVEANSEIRRCLIQIKNSLKDEVEKEARGEGKDRPFISGSVSFLMLDKDGLEIVTEESLTLEEVKESPEFNSLISECEDLGLTYKLDDECFKDHEGLWNWYFTFTVSGWDPEPEDLFVTFKED